MELHSQSKWPAKAVVTLVLMLIAIRLPMLGNPLLDHYSFRQTQTAITAYWFAQEGIKLPDYPLPVLGRPWTCPLEFPTFQFLVCGLDLVGLSIDRAARLAAVLVFAACVLVAVRMFARLGSARGTLLSFLGFCALSPFAIVWSRACLVDYTSVLLSLLYLAICLQMASKGWTARGGVLATLIGSLAAVTKVTTLPIYWTPVALVALDSVWQTVAGIRRRSSSSEGTRYGEAVGPLLQWAVVLLVPLVCAVVWTHVSDAVKAASPATSWLVSDALGKWNFGSWEQRFALKSWETVTRRIQDVVVPFLWPLVLYGIVALFRQPRALVVAVAGLVLGSIATVLVFTNLYVVHDYYLCAITIPIWFLAALGLSELGGYYKARAWKAGCHASAMVLMAVVSATSGYVAPSYDYKAGLASELLADQIIPFCEKVKGKVPADQEILVFGDDWNPRIPYYARRKAFMVKEEFIPDSLVSEYVATNRVKFVVARAGWFKRVHALWPGARKISTEGHFALFEVPVPAGRQE